MSEEQIQKTWIVLVYGTLRRGFGNYRRLLEGRGEFLGETTVKGTMYSLHAYPAIQLKGDHEIKCEAFKIDEQTLKRLDALEGHPSFYQRTEVGSEYGAASIYTMAEIPRGSSVVESGDWTRHEQAR